MKNDKHSRTKRAPLPRDYADILADLKQLVADSRRRAMSTVNRELVRLYWQIGGRIVRQQKTARWGDAVVEQLAADLRAAFPDLKGLSRDNLFRMRQFHMTCRLTDEWLARSVLPDSGKVGTLSRQSSPGGVKIIGTASRPLKVEDRIVSALAGDLSRPGLAEIVLGLSWSHRHLPDRTAGRTADPSTLGTIDTRKGEPEVKRCSGNLTQAGPVRTTEFIMTKRFANK